VAKLAFVLATNGDPKTWEAAPVPASTRKAKIPCPVAVYANLTFGEEQPEKRNTIRSESAEK
jgi:hypothetical protein